MSENGRKATRTIRVYMESEKMRKGFIKLIGAMLFVIAITAYVYLQTFGNLPVRTDPAKLFKSWACVEWENHTFPSKREQIFINKSVLFSTLSRDTSIYDYECSFNRNNTIPEKIYYYNGTIKIFPERIDTICRCIIRHKITDRICIREGLNCRDSICDSYREAK